MSHWILREPCRCVLAVVTGCRTPAEAAEFLFGSEPLEVGMAMELVTGEEFDRDIRPTFGEHTCGGAS